MSLCHRGDFRGRPEAARNRHSIIVLHFIELHFIESHSFRLYIFGQVSAIHRIARPPHSVISTDLIEKSTLARTRPHLIIIAADETADSTPLRLAYKFGMRRAPCLSRPLHLGFPGRLYTTRLGLNYKTFVPVRLLVPKSTRRTAMSATMTVTLPTVRPLQPPPGSDIDFGAQIDEIDLENLTGL